MEINRGVTCGWNSDQPQANNGSSARRAFGDPLSELDLYSFLRTRVHSRGRFGRTREVQLDLPEEMINRLVETIRLNFELGGRQATLK